jgi:hypothetical protein
MRLGEPVAAVFFVENFAVVGEDEEHSNGDQTVDDNPEDGHSHLRNLSVVAGDYR